MQAGIEEKLLHIVSNKFNKRIKDVNEQLLGHDVNFTPVELAIFLKELENEFNICFQQDDIVKGMFTDIANISLLIEKEITKEQEN
ncbi:hypothetical protein P4H42_19180 [Paenibacillus macerans]|uniref:hypothetical protein n=1 Tax=Paenibacillus macerans TaxID=44252 RepID=UPI002DBBAEF0|nr:hypothetical protein [Paenibacillus macerans]MEC0331738.1 hypothetical protein [Paenibacillus macerans]